MTSSRQSFEVDLYAWSPTCNLQPFITRLKGRQISMENFQIIQASVFFWPPAEVKSLEDYTTASGALIILNKWDCPTFLRDLLFCRFILTVSDCVVEWSFYPQWRGTHSVWKMPPPLDRDFDQKCVIAFCSSWIIQRSANKGMFVLCCLTKGRMMVNWQSAHCVSVGSWPVSLALKGPFGIKQHKLPVIVNASVIPRLLPHIFKPSPLYPIPFRALCYSCFPAGWEENRFLTREPESSGPAGLCTPNECCM